MRGIFRYFTISLSVAMVVASCSKFDEESPILQVPTVEDVGSGAYYSTFYLPALWYLDEGLSNGDVLDIDIELLPLANRLQAYRYDALLTVGDKHAVRFLIAPDATEDLPDGKYLLRGYRGANDRFVHEFVLTVKNRVVMRVQNVPDYSAKFDEGDGSQDNPFKIYTENQFADMCDLAEEDPSYGLGKYFVQLADIELPSNMGIVVEEGWYSVDFAGNYNGMNNTISGFAFNGIRDDNAYDIGLFSTLHNGASIENVLLNTSGIHGVAERGGILAGSVAEGATVTIKNCKLRGSISDSKGSIGGLVGYADKATINIENVDMGMNIQCSPNDSNDTGNGYRVGGLIGFAIDSNISILGGEIDLDNLYVEGGWCVGGLIGETRDCEIHISGPELIRSTTKDLKTIVGTQYVGGAIGYLDANKDAYIENLTIAYPILGVKYVGGLIGSTNSKVDKYDDFDLELMDTYISSNITGSEDVGGFIGLVKNHGASGKSDGSCETCFYWKGDCSFGSIEGNKTQIMGDKNVGGLFGRVEKGTKLMTAGVDISIAATITANTSCAGGVIGYADDLDIYIYESMTLSSTKVVAPLYAGGFVGYMNGGYISASTSLWNAGEDGCDVIPSYEKVLSDDGANVYAKVECGSTSQYVGGVVGFMASNSKIGTICTQSEVTGGSRVGGIVGGAIGSNIVINCSYPNGFVQGSGIEIGGIVGRIEGDVEVTNCINYASVDGGGSGAEIGGVVGYSKYNGEMPHINYCVNVAPVTGCGVVGGVLGLSHFGIEDYHRTVMVENCANFGKILGTSTSGYNGHTGFGGIMGHSNNTQGAQLAHCANHGDIEVNCSAHGVGGVVGAIGNDPTGANEEYNYHVWECANRGNITGGSSRFHVGGIVGYMEEGTVTNGNHACVEGCYNWGDIDVPVDSDHGLGGIAGFLDHYSELWRNVNFKKPSGLTNSENTGDIWGDNKGTHTINYNYSVYDEHKMSDASNFGDLNINQEGSFWVMDAGDPHPQIRNCPFQNSTYDPNGD